MISEYRKYSDEELLGKLNQSDRRAFDEIYRRYWPGLYQSAYCILKDRDGCMDVLQEVFLWLWENRVQVSARFLKAYLHAAVKFKVANYIRNGKVRASFFEEIKDITEPGIVVADNLEVKELARIITHFTGQLPERCREVFLLSRQEHLSNKEIAGQLGISVKTVENQMTTALKKLKSSLSRISSFFLFFL